MVPGMLREAPHTLGMHARVSLGFTTHSAGNILLCACAVPCITCEALHMLYCMQVQK